MAPGLLMRCLLLRHHLADFFAEHTLDFVLHRFSAGFAEMRPYKVGGFADFLHHRGRSVWLGPGEGHACGSVGKFVCHRRLLFQPAILCKNLSQFSNCAGNALGGTTSADTLVRRNLPKLFLQGIPGMEPPRLGGG